MKFTDQERQDIKSKIIEKLNQKYEIAAEQVTRVEKAKLDELDRVAESQLNYNRRISNDSSTVREILELERNGTTTTD